MASSDTSASASASEAQPTAKAKRASKRSCTPIEPNRQPKLDKRHSIWTEEQLTKLIQHLKREGFNGDYSTFSEVLPNFSENTLRGVFSQLSRSTEQSSDEPLEKKSAIHLAPIEEWMAVIKDSIEVQRLGSNPALMMEWLGMFEDHPNPDSCCGVDYQAIYFYISDLLEGRIPKQLDAPTASKLYLLFQQLVSTISRSAQASQELLVKTAKLPPVCPPIDREGKNQVLRERRRTKWTEEEEQQANVIKSGDLDQIKKLYYDKPGLNPFSLPPSI